MSAVMKHMGAQWQGLEPEGLGHDLLTEWAPWYREDKEGGHSWAVRPRVDRGFHGTPPERVHRVERIVAKIKVEHHRYYRVISRYYLDQLLPHQMASTLGYTEGWVRSMLLAACGLVQQRYLEQKELAGSKRLS